MAMDYKILKTITIGGETMGVDTEIGDMKQVIVDGTVSPIRTYVKLAEYEIPEDGVYLLQVYNRFPPPSTAGAYSVSSAWGEADGTLNKFLDDEIVGPRAFRHEITTAEIFTKGYKVCSYAWTNKLFDGTVRSILRVTRLLNYEVGGNP